MIDLIVKYAGLVICACIIVGCICRINLLTGREHRMSWFLMYLCCAAFSGGIATDLVINRFVDWYTAAGVAAILLHFIHTRKHWKRCPPNDALCAFTPRRSIFK